MARNNLYCSGCELPFVPVVSAQHQIYLAQGPVSLATLAWSWMWQLALLLLYRLVGGVQTRVRTTFFLLFSSGKLCQGSQQRQGEHDPDKQSGFAEWRAAGCLGTVLWERGCKSGVLVSFGRVQTAIWRRKGTVNEQFELGVCWLPLVICFAVKLVIYLSYFLGKKGRGFVSWKDFSTDPIGYKTAF